MSFVQNLMAIDFQIEKLLSSNEAAKALPAIEGKRPHVTSIWRWCRKGVRGVHLEYVRSGNRICTSVEALVRFQNALAEADKSDRVSVDRRVTQTVSNAARRKSIARADEVLRRAGIL